MSLIFLIVAVSIVFIIFMFVRLQARSKKKYIPNLNDDLFPTATHQSQAEKSAHPYERLNTLFSPAERSFYGVLKQAVGDEALVFGKVRVADVLTPKKGERGVWQTAFNKISAKHFDFIICNKDDLSFVCGIELDDRSHNSAKTKVRDAFLEEACQSADFPLIRFPAKAAYKISEIREALSAHLSVSDVNEVMPLTAVIELSEIEKVSVASELNETEKKSCPKCSSEMTVRVTKKGSSVGNEFWGCSAFPKCRHMEPLRG